MRSSSEALCLSCGFCCDGTLFTAAPLNAAEVEPSRRLQLRVLAKADGTHSLEQPCAALRSQGCSAYAHRPSACRRYRCDLLTALEADEVSLDEAQALVRRVREAESVVARELPAEAGPRQPLRLRAWKLQETSGLSEAGLKALTSMEELLLHHFRGRRG